MHASTKGQTWLSGDNWKGMKNNVEEDPGQFVRHPGYKKPLQFQSNGTGDILCQWGVELHQVVPLDPLRSSDHWTRKGQGPELEHPKTYFRIFSKIEHALGKRKERPWDYGFQNPLNWSARWNGDPSKNSRKIATGGPDWKYLKGLTHGCPHFIWLRTLRRR